MKIMILSYNNNNKLGAVMQTLRYFKACTLKYGMGVIETLI